MSDTYVGWDGKSYPWPPPDGWYHASDGRWWAPGTGPNPPPDQPPTGDSGFETSDTAQMATPSQHDPDPTRAYQPPGEQPAVLLDQPWQDPSPAGGATVPGFGPGSGRADDPAPREQDWNPTGAPRGDGGGDGGGSNRGRFLMVAVGFVAAVVVAGLAYTVFGTGDDGDSDAAPTIATADDTTTSDTSAGDDGTATTNPADDDDPTTTGDDTTTTGDTTTNDTATTATTLAPDEAADQIDRFRAILADADLSSDQLSDTDLTTLGTTFCLFAAASGDEDDFDSFRQQAVDSADTPIGGDRLEFVVDAAVVVFCPEEADRLGISL